jgi:hypothetical protein
VCGFFRVTTLHNDPGRTIVGWSDRVEQGEPMDITISRNDGKITVRTPYNPTFPARARNMGGKWSGTSTAWVFDARDEQRVRKLCVDIFGTDGTPVALATVQLDAALWYRIGNHQGDEKEMYFAGRKVASRQTRDSSVQLGEGVIIISGKFPSSGGSMKYPGLAIESKDNLFLEIRDVPAGHHDVSREDRESVGVTIVDISATEGEAAAETLRKERATLVARLAEIDALLGSE